MQVTVVRDGERIEFSCLKSLLVFNLAEHLKGKYQSLQVVVTETKVDQRQRELWPVTY